VDIHQKLQNLLILHHGQFKHVHEHRYFNYNNTVTDKYADFSKIKKVYHTGKQGKRGGAIAANVWNCQEP